MVKALAIELARYGIRASARYGIRASALLPGWIESGVTASRFDDDTFVRTVMPPMPVRRWGTGEDFAGTRCTWPARPRPSTPGTRS